MGGLALKSSAAATEFSLDLKSGADDFQRQNPASMCHQSHRFHNLCRDLSFSFSQRYNYVFLRILTLKSGRVILIPSSGETGFPSFQ